jgi:hypothetical protein
MTVSDSLEQPCNKSDNINKVISTDEDPGLRIESFAVINLRGVSTNNSIISTRLLYISTMLLYKLLTACSKLVDNLEQTVRTQLVDCLLADLLQDV